MGEQVVSCATITLLALAAVTLQLIGLSLFVFGFFPVNSALSGVSGSESYLPPIVCDSSSNAFQNVSAIPDDCTPKQLRSMFQELSGIPPLFDKLVLMVIDGLPAEFVLGKDGQPLQQHLMESMPFTHRLLNSGKAIGFHSKAAPPTVTMPRLKAMMSGSIGGFLDVAMNFNTQAMLDDNLLAQLVRIGWKMVMLGDETWIKLFPGNFMRHDGVSSFFVKDTVQVDKNVSRHLENELSRDDWDLLILHYLGVDHIGHIDGRDSFLMPPKLKEMDEVVEKIYLSLIEAHDDVPKSTLLVIVSDHGMTLTGNHGGSSYAETDSLAVFVGLPTKSVEESSVSNRKINQVDIAPTLALLFGVPIPRNNIGVLIPDVFQSFADDKLLRALELNSWQLFWMLQARFSNLHGGKYLCKCIASIGEECDYSIENRLCCLYMNTTNQIKSRDNLSEHKISQDAAILAHREFLTAASDWLSHRITDKPFSLLAGGLAAMTVSCLLLIGLTFRLGIEFYHHNCRSFHGSGILSNSWRLEEIFVFITAFITVIGMGSSSLVEEEQYIWHFMVATLYMLLLRKVILHDYPENNKPDTKKKTNGSHMLSILLLIFVERVLRSWHQGGVNWVHLPDISKLLEQSGSSIIMRCQICSALLLMLLGIGAMAKSNLKLITTQFVLTGFLLTGLSVLSYIIKSDEVSGGLSGSSNYFYLNIIYSLFGVSTVGAAIFLPWIWPIDDHRRYSLSSVSNHVEPTYLIGLLYTLSWCLLQLILQQPVNSFPIFLLLLQIIITINLYSCGDYGIKEWVYVSLLYYNGMAGHFSLGNSNTLATINVAGAFIGLSRHSTTISGLLMFCITFASPMLVLLSMVIFIAAMPTGNHSTKNDCSGCRFKKRLVFPCLVPLTLNSLFLTSYTMVLLLMRNHLFVWSVFSPKYMYVCATTICVYVGLAVVIGTEWYATCALGCGELLSKRMNFRF